jgi:hypothetical protein
VLVALVSDGARCIASGPSICSDCDRLFGLRYAFGLGWCPSASGPERDPDGCEWTRREEADGTQGFEWMRVWMPPHTRNACPSAAKRRASHEQFAVNMPCASSAAVATRHRRTSTLDAQLVVNDDDDEEEEEEDEGREAEEADADEECVCAMVSTPHAS